MLMIIRHTLALQNLPSSISPVEIQIENTITSSVNIVKLLGVYINGRPNFDNHVNQICKKARKRYTLYLRHVNL